MSLGALVLLFGAQDSGWMRVQPGIELRFPADHGAHHGYQIEWWYLTGQFEDDSGERFGFQFTVFRRGLEPGEAQAGESSLRAREAYAGHLVLTDVARAETRFAERSGRASPLVNASTGELDVRMEDWSLVRVPFDRAGATDASEELRLRAADPGQGFAYAFTLRPEKDLVLHGEQGYSQKGSDPGNASAYVSWPRLALEGTLELDGVTREVRGGAWFDHEFGSSVLADGAVGWDWFGLQLDDGRELMLFVLRDASGVALEASAATLVERDGTSRALRRKDFTLQSHSTWSSPRNEAVYPASWTIRIPGTANLAELELSVTPLVPDCELVGQSSTGLSYWEGPVRLDGPVTGRGYAELTGYASSMAGRF